MTQVFRFKPNKFYIIKHEDINYVNISGTQLILTKKKYGSLIFCEVLQSTWGTENKVRLS